MQGSPSTGQEHLHEGIVPSFLWFSPSFSRLLCILLAASPSCLSFLCCSFSWTAPILFSFFSLSSLFAPLLTSSSPWLPAMTYVFSLDLSPELQTYLYNSFLSIFIKCSVIFSNLMCESTTGDVFSLSLYQGSQCWPPAAQLFELQTFGIFDLSLFTHSHVQSSENESFHLSLKNRSHIGHGRRWGKPDGEWTKSHFLGYKNCFTSLVECGFHGYRHLSKWIRLCIEDMCFAVGKLHLRKQYGRKDVYPQ